MVGRNMNSEYAKVFLYNKNIFIQIIFYRNANCNNTIMYAATKLTYRKGKVASTTIMPHKLSFENLVFVILSIFFANRRMIPEKYKSMNEH